MKAPLMAPLELTIEADERIGADGDPAEPAPSQRTCVSPEPEQRAMGVEEPPIPGLGAVPRHRHAGSIGGLAPLAERVAREEAGNTDQRGEEADPHDGRVVVTGDGAPARRVVGAELVLARGAGAPRQRCPERAHRADGERAGSAGERGLGAEEARRGVGIAQPRPDRAREPGVVHGPVPPEAVEVAREVVGVLGHQPGGGACRVGACRVERAPYGAGDVVVDVDGSLTPGHVGAVDPPAVERDRLAQPPVDHGSPPVDEAAAELGVGVVELGQAASAEPALVVVGVVVEGEVTGLDRAWVALRGQEPVVARAAVVRRQVTYHPAATAVGLGGERRERRITAEQRIDPLEGRGVVAVRAAGGEERGEPDDGRTEVGDVVEMPEHAPQAPAVGLARGGAVGVGEGRVPGGERGPVGDHVGGRGTGG